MKNTLSLTLLLAMTFLVGCATPTSGRPTFEYSVQTGNNWFAVQKQVNDLAKDGWVVQSLSVGDSGYVYFL